MTSSAGLSSLSSMLSFDPAQFASKLMSKGDTNGDSALSFSEFSALSGSSSASSTAASSACSTSSQGATNLFDAIDTDSDGALSETELTSFGQKLSDEASAFMLQVQEQGLFGGSGQGGGGSQSSSSDPMDTNKDGVVSAMERLAAMQASLSGQSQQPSA
jgi:hypothetical protein